MKTKVFVLLALLCCAFFVPSVYCKVVLGSTSGNVTLTNPDNSTFFYDHSNITTYDYVGNAPDGWWMFIGEETDEDSYWILGVVLGILAVGVAVALITINRGKQK